MLSCTVLSYFVSTALGETYHLVVKLMDVRTLEHVRLICIKLQSIICNEAYMNNKNVHHFVNVSSIKRNVLALIWLKLRHSSSELQNDNEN